MYRIWQIRIEYTVVTHPASIHETPTAYYAPASIEKLRKELSTTNLRFIYTMHMRASCFASLATNLESLYEVTRITECDNPSSSKGLLYLRNIQEITPRNQEFKIY